MPNITLYAVHFMRYNLIWVVYFLWMDYGWGEDIDIIW